MILRYEKSSTIALIFLFLEKSKFFVLALPYPWKSYALDPPAAWSSPLLSLNIIPQRGLQWTPSQLPHSKSPIRASLYHIALSDFLHGTFYLLLVLSPLFLLWKKHACHRSICSKSEYIPVYIYVYSYTRDYLARSNAYSQYLLCTCYGVDTFLRALPVFNPHNNSNQVIILTISILSVRNLRVQWLTKVK